MSKSIQDIANDFKVNRLTHHILLCCDQTNPKCCSKDDSLISWNYLKEQVEIFNRDNAHLEVFRTKANCLRLCQQGPIAVVYPDGTWYHSCTPEVLNRILQEHILQNKPVKEYIIESHPLKGFPV